MDTASIELGRMIFTAVAVWLFCAAATRLAERKHWSGI